MPSLDSPTLQLEEKDQVSQYHFSFTGSGGEYFKIWIVNLLLNMCTLGIYSAWAKVRNKRYFYGNTQLNNTSFEYHGDPMQIFKGRAIAFSVFSIYIIISEALPLIGFIFAAALALIFPFFIRASLRFNAVMSSYRNIHFGFTGSLLDCYKYFLFLPLAVFIIPMLGLFATGYFAESDNESTASIIGGVAMLAMAIMYALMPLLIALINRFMMNNYHYGNTSFTTSVSVGGYYGIYLKWFCLSLAATVVIGAATVAYMSLLAPAQELMQMEQEQQAEIFSQLFEQGPSLFGLFIVFSAVFTLLQAYLTVSLRNYLFNHSQLDDIEFGSQLSTFALAGLLVSNFILIIISVGLLIPWTKTRVAHYVANQTNLSTQSSLDHFIGATQAKQNALGEEFGEAFDVDVDLGLAI